MSEHALPLEQFAALGAVAGCVHGFVTRVPEIAVKEDKTEALRRLDIVHRAARAELGLASFPFMTAEQVHGRQLEVIDRKPTRDDCFPDCDGLLTNQPGVCLGIYVADCCAVYLVDPVERCIALLHSGKMGTALDITGNAIELMGARFGSRPENLTMQLSPCIRPPHYEIDFAAAIVASGRARGVKNIYDAGVCTACDLGHYYSYRAEQGKTGRMLALLALT
ncbi:MAG: polyphenol oxidase family protein [Chthoniobacterales bacterium]